MVGAILGKLDARPNKAQRGESHILIEIFLKDTLQCWLSKKPIENWKLEGNWEISKKWLYSKLVTSFIDECKKCGGDEVVLETEVINIPALKLYESTNIE